MSHVPPAAAAPEPPTPMALEVLVVPVADPDRAKRFYADLGWRLDFDFPGEDGYRVMQFTPPGSACSIILGRGISSAAPGSLQDVHLVVGDLEAARADLLRRGVSVSAAFHDPGGIFHHADPKHLRTGPNPERRSYASYATFQDPDGNAWVLQEVTAHLTGLPAAGDPRFTPELVAVLRGLGT